MGGTIDIGNSYESGGTVQRASCLDAACSLPASPLRFYEAGAILAVPELGTWSSPGAGFDAMILHCQANPALVYPGQQKNARQMSSAPKIELEEEIQNNDINFEGANGYRT
jgi:hypothetical protein